MEDAPECVICLDGLELGRALFTAECDHSFHFSCLMENVNHDEANSDKCPICRMTQTRWPEQTEGLIKAHPYCEFQCKHTGNLQAANIKMQRSAAI